MASNNSINAPDTANALIVGTGSGYNSVAVVIDGVLISSHASGTPSWLANGPPGYVLTAQTNLPPAWVDPTATGDITQVGDVTSGAAFNSTQGTQLTSTTAGFTLSVATNGAGVPGPMNVVGATSSGVAGAGSVFIEGGQSTGSGAAGAININGGVSSGTGAGGGVILQASNGPSGGGGIQILGGSASTLGVGGALILTGGAAAGSNQNAQDTIITSSKGTGSGRVGKIYLLADASGVAAGSTVHTSVNRLIVNGSVASLVSSTPATIATFATSANSMAGCTISYTIDCSDGTDFQAVSGLLVVALVDKASVLTTSISTSGAEATAVSAGTLTTSFSFSGHDLQITAITSLTPSVFRVTYSVHSHSQQQITAPL